MEPIKQEIINNIFENGDKLITGPILQTVLIDMIDDVNVKDQEILSKTGSWDDAATQIPNLATKEEVTNLSESVARDLENVDLTGYATEQWVQDQGYLKEHQDISNLATKSELNAAETNLQGNITSLSESVARDLANVDVDLTGYATEQWVQNQGYLTEHQDISNLATKGELTSVSESVQTDITNLSESVANSAVWKKGEGQDSVVQILPAISSEGVYSTPTAIGKGAIATGYSKASGSCSHAEGYNTLASAPNSHAEGNSTKAEGFSSHAEGWSTEASGWNSHAEGWNTNASGQGSHAEGNNTVASNAYEHAQGQYNHNSTNQIFSVGTGNSVTDRRNAVSILAVPNSDTQVVTASFFVQNVGGYDGTNPTPGTNDLATVVSKVSSIWKKGEGQDSVVQAIADGTNLPTASGERAIAVGYETIASGSYSHAEGRETKALGLASHTEGYQTEASGVGSHAEGRITKATGHYSHAEGDQTNASGTSNHAEGNATTALGSWSHAEGYATNTLGNWSHAEGHFTIASGSYSHAEGYFTKALGYISHAEGAYTTASGDHSHAEGRYTTASGYYSHAEGHGTTTPGTSSHAEGAYAITSGSFSHAEGAYTTASGDYSHAEGDHTNASGYISHAEGAGTTALGQYSHAEGQNTNASGFGSHTEGAGTTALDQYSHAEGDNTVASGSHSHTEGGHTLTSNQYEHAQGRYNYTSSNQIFSIGAGNSDTDRKNAVSVLAVENNNKYTASVFVQNIGGYDGTNPTPGTNDLATVINGMSTGGGSSETLWKKGEGTDSIVQVIADGTDQPTATGTRAIATGMSTTASEQFSHAEGSSTNASGDSSHAEGTGTRAEGPFSHAEGYYTTASGEGSHAEGYQTVTHNSYECALGMCNHNSEGQIFSVGAGEGDPFNPFDPKPITRRNAISVLAVPNSDTQINTASVFVQNVGGYDGTNPLPGTNDLATVINNLSSSGGSSGGESGNYLPLTGGTLTGDLRVNSSMGVGTGPQGTYCLAVGNSTTNTGGSHYALAVGENCQVDGAYGGVSLGRENVVNAAFGLATGFRCRVNYMAGYAGGCRSTASANFAFAAGFGAEATRVGQVVLGAYNELDPSGNNESTGSYAVILANGKSSTWHQDRPGNITRSNGLAIKWDGGIDIKYQGSTVTLQDKLNEIEAKISSGGTATSTETWTFTLDDGSTVTKNILMA